MSDGTGQLQKGKRYMKTGDEKANIAVVLAAGKGTRMKSDVPKQYLMVEGKPVLAHSLLAFEGYDEIQGIVLVAGKNDVDWCRENIVRRYGFRKIMEVIAGGAQRYDSVYAGLTYIKDRCPDCGLVLIHDGARPLIDRELLQRNLTCARLFGCAVTGMPSKDTMKICDADGNVESTPPRDRIWQVQTPQTFLFDEIYDAYDRLFQLENPSSLSITDDAMVMETFGTRQVRMCLGTYSNLKITTPEDLLFAEQMFSMK